MDAGRLNKRITLQRQERVQAPSGQIVGQWVDVCTVWAEMRCTDSKCVDADGVQQHEGLYRFSIRWRAGLTAEMRVLWQGRIFQLVGPPADWQGNRDGLTLLTREVM